ncbi:MAG: recombinase family protein [Pseudomonadota bacterium]
MKPSPENTDIITERTDMSAPIAVAYVRVSSAAQVAKGQGAESQAARCADYARQKGYRVIKTFEDKAISGSLVDRPGMKQLLAYVRKRRKDKIRVVIDDISRLARGLEAHLALRTAIANAGGVLESPSIEFGEDSDSQLIEHLLASVSAHARVKNAEQTRNRMEARIRQGYWPFWACIGFKFEKREGHGKVLVRDEPVASIIQRGLEGFDSGAFQTKAEVKRYFESEPDFPKTGKGDVRATLVHEILTRVLYAGMVERPEWGVALRPGKHDGLISFETFEKIQKRLRGKSYAPARADINEDFPLRGAVMCGDCGNPLTANWSKSKTGKRHAYYSCFNKACPSARKSIRRADLEGAFEAILKGLTPTKPLFALVKAMFADAWEQQRARSKDAGKTLKADLVRIETEIAGLIDRIVAADQPLVVAAYEARIDRLERDKLVLTERIEKSGGPKRPFEEMFELSLRFLSNPWNLWEKGSLENKKTALRLAFQGPLIYCRKTGFRTPETSFIFNMLEGESAMKSRLAETKGFEPSIRG